ncbi:hypothetical protein [Nostoc sp. DSM 114160]
MWIEAVVDNSYIRTALRKIQRLSHSSGDYQSLNHNQGVLL